MRTVDYVCRVLINNIRRNSLGVYFASISYAGKIADKINLTAVVPIGCHLKAYMWGSERLL